MRRRLLLALALVFLAGPFAPRRAGADITDSLLISAYVAGGVAVIALAAILLASREDEPDFYSLVEQRPEEREPAGLHVGCRMENGNLALACW